MVGQVDIVALQRMLDRLHFMRGELTALGRHLLETTADARSYGGEYAPWVQSLADQCDCDLRTLADEIESLANRFSVFEQSKKSEERANPSSE
jgi:hypothetical protein